MEGYREFMIAQTHRLKIILEVPKKRSPQNFVINEVKSTNGSISLNLNIHITLISAIE